VSDPEVEVMFVVQAGRYVPTSKKDNLTSGMMIERGLNIFISSSDQIFSVYRISYSDVAGREGLKL